MIFITQLKVAVDSEMCKTAHQGSMDLSNLLIAVLQGTVKPSACLPLSVLFIQLNRAFQVK